MVVTISELAREAGVSPDTVRYYERRGLLPKAPRGANGYRRYDEELSGRLRFIKSAQRAGLRLDDVQELLEIMDRGGCPCGHAAAAVGRRLAEVDAEVGRLATLRGQLVALGETSESCTGPDRNDWWRATPDDKKGGVPS